MTNKITYAPPTKHVENLFTFSDLQSHHCEGSEPNSSQSFFLHHLGTMEVIEFFDTKFIKYIDLSHVQTKRLLHLNQSYIKLPFSI
jgi:hypothetical protein